MEGKIKPEKIILVGPAWDWARNNGFEPAEGLVNFKLVEVPGDTHHYEDVVGLGNLVREFLKTR